MSRLRLPREHGFWVMLLAALITAVVRAPRTAPALAASALVLAGAILVGSVFWRTLRRSEAAQLASAPILGASGFPVSWLAGEPALDAARTAAVFATVFLSSALVVRGVLAQGRRRQRSARIAIGGALVLSFLAAAAFALAGDAASAGATAAAGVFCGAVAVTAPPPSQLKKIGLGLAGLATVTALILVA